MDSWLTALIAVGGALAGSALTGFITFKIANRDQVLREREELRGALAAYGAALDRLNIQLVQLPQASGIEESWANRLIAQWQELDWVMGRLSTATVGRGAMRALDELATAHNRLILVAPHPVLDAAEVISELLEDVKPGASEWKLKWQEARNRLTKASREALNVK